MAYVINGERPWFKAKLAHALEALEPFETFTASETYDATDIQALIDGLVALSAALKEGA